MTLFFMMRQKKLAASGRLTAIKNPGEVSGIFCRKLPIGNMPALHGAEQPLGNAFMLLFHLPQPVFCPFPLGRPIHRAFAFDDRIACLSHCRGNLYLRLKNKRPYHGQIFAGKIGHRRKTSYPPLQEQVHYKCFHRIVVVMTQGDFIAPKPFCCVM